MATNMHEIAQCVLVSASAMFTTGLPGDGEIQHNVGTRQIRRNDHVSARNIAS